MYDSQIHPSIHPNALPHHIASPSPQKNSSPSSSLARDSTQRLFPVQSHLRIEVSHHRPVVDIPLRLHVEEVCMRRHRRVSLARFGVRLLFVVGVLCGVLGALIQRECAGIHGDILIVRSNSCTSA